MPEPMTFDEIADHADRAIHKIDSWGERGLTMVTTREIEAMALLLTMLAADDAPREEGEQT